MNQPLANRENAGYLTIWALPSPKFPDSRFIGQNRDNHIGEGVGLSTGKRGRQTNARRAASSAQRRKNSTRFNAALSLAGLGATVVTAGSTISEPPSSVAVNIAEGNQKVTTVASARQIPVRISVLRRARAASRSEVRTSSADAAALNDAASAPTETADSSGVLTASDRQNLRAFAADSNQLDTIVEDTQQEINHQIATAQVAQHAADVAAAKKARLKLESQYSTSGNLTYPDQVGQPTRSYSAPLPSAAQIAERKTPIAGGYQLSARFGERGWIWSTGWHTGIDFVVPTGTVVRAATSGTIINAGWAGAYGNRIEIDCGDGYIVTYNHMSRIDRTSGVVTAGQELGRSGATGNITGPHLHFEVLYNGHFVNPAVWLWGASR